MQNVVLWFGTEIWAFIRSLGLQSNAVEKRTIRQPARPLAGCFTVVLKVGEFHAGMDTRKSRTIGIEDFAENYIQPAPDAEGW